MELSPNTHIPVMIEPILDFLKPEYRTLFDGTLGGGGYVRRFLQKQPLKIFAGDLDHKALERFQKSQTQGVEILSSKDLEFMKQNILSANGDLSTIPNITLIQSNFSEIIKFFPDSFLDFVVLDLGFSSNQLEYSERGFSYQKSEEILDFRYDVTMGFPAWKQIQFLSSAKELGRIVYQFSGEDLSNRIGVAIWELAHSKQNQPFTVGETVAAIEKAIPRKLWHKRNGIMSRTWQAIRIWTNQEFEHLEKFLTLAKDKLSVNGRLAIVCFHSLEDKLVTKYFRNLAKPIEIDDFGNKVQYYNLITPKVITPNETEIEQNRRARSATLRVIERLI